MFVGLKRPLIVVYESFSAVDYKGVRTFYKGTKLYQTFLLFQKNFIDIRTLKMIK